jgi:hypothetical protein
MTQGLRGSIADEHGWGACPRVVLFHRRGIDLYTRPPSFLYKQTADVSRRFRLRKCISCSRDFGGDMVAA